MTNFVIPSIDLLDGNVVRLKQGDSIKVFEEPEEDKKTSAKEAKADKKAAADKNAGKENK